MLPHLEAASELPHSEQIANYYREAIESGRLRTGDRLPPIRTVAEAAKVTRATVQAAYKQLSDHGLVEGTVGRGTTVLRSGAPDESPLSPFALAAMRQVRDAATPLRTPADKPEVANFAELNPQDGLFPLNDLRSCIDRALRDRGAELFRYGHPSGLPELRNLLARRSGERGATGEQVLVTAGAQQALDLVLRTLCKPGDAVAVPVPTYHQMIGLLQAHGLQLVPVPSGPAGIDLAALEQVLKRGNVRLLYLMPTFHNPTGRTLDTDQRVALMELVARTQVPVLEDEYQSQLRFEGRDEPSLRSLDPRGLTVTVHSFSKGLFPGLRIGWLHASEAMLAPLGAVKRFMDLETSSLLQAALVNFVQYGSLDRYLTRLRSELAQRHRLVQEQLLARLPEDCSITRVQGGFLLWLELPERVHGTGAGERLATLAAERGVLVVPGSAFDPTGKPSNGCRLSVARVETSQIPAGCAVLADIARLLVTPPASSNRLLL
jgi:GntR family transcriptional regulator/MocR family aminotransferase